MINPKATALIFNINNNTGSINGNARTENTVELVFDLIDKRETKLNITLTPKLPKDKDTKNNLQFWIPSEANNKSTIAKDNPSKNSKKKLYMTFARYKSTGA